MLFLTWAAAGTAFFPVNIPSWTSRRRRKRLAIAREIAWLRLSWTMVRGKPQDGGEPNALNLEGGVLALEPLGTGDSTVTTTAHPAHVTSITLFPVTHLRHRRSSFSISFLSFLFLFFQEFATKNNGRKTTPGGAPGHF